MREWEIWADKHTDRKEKIDDLARKYQMNLICSFAPCSCNIKTTCLIFVQSPKQLRYLLLASMQDLLVCHGVWHQRVGGRSSVDQTSSIFHGWSIILDSWKFGGPAGTLSFWTSSSAANPDIVCYFRRIVLLEKATFIEESCCHEGFASSAEAFVWVVSVLCMNAMTQGFAAEHCIELK